MKDTLGDSETSNSYYCLCGVGVPWERKSKGEEADKDRDSSEDTLRAAMDATSFKRQRSYLFLGFSSSSLSDGILYFDLKEKESNGGDLRISLTLSHMSFHLHSLGLCCRTLNGYLTERFRKKNTIIRKRNKNTISCRDLWDLFVSVSIHINIIIFLYSILDPTTNKN